MEANAWVEVANTTWISCSMTSTPTFNATYSSGFNSTLNEYVVETSHDAGVSWSPVDFFTGDSWHAPEGISSNGQYVYVVGESFEVIQSRDFGSTWQTVYPLNNTYLSYDLICDPSGQYVVACGASRTSVDISSLLASSSDYGSTWTSVVLPINCLSLAADNSWNTVWVTSASGGLLYKTTDKGLSWTLGANLTFSMATMTSSASGQYLTILGGNSYYSLDFGEHWALISDGSIFSDPSTVCLSATVDSSGRYVAAVGNKLGFPNGTVYLSDTYGQTWFQSTLPTTDAEGYHFYCGLGSNSNGSQLMVAEENDYVWHGSITLQSEDMTATYPPTAQPTLHPTPTPSFRPTSMPSTKHEDDDDDGEAEDVIIAVSVVAVFLFIAGGGGIIWYCWKKKAETSSLNARLMSSTGSTL